MGVDKISFGSRKVLLTAVTIMIYIWDLGTVPNKTDDNKPNPMDEESLYRAFRQFKYKSKDEGPIFVSDTLTRHAFNTDAQNLKVTNGDIDRLNPMD